MDLAKNVRITECVVYSSDTDVFVLLIYYYGSLPQLSLSLIL